MIDAAEVNMTFVGFGFFNVVLMVILKTKVGFFFIVLTISNFNQLNNILFMLLKGENVFKAKYRMKLKVSSIFPRLLQ